MFGINRRPRDDVGGDEMGITYTFVDAATMRAPKMYGKKMLKAADIGMLKAAVSRKHIVSRDELFVCNVQKGKIHRELSNTDSVTDIGREDDIFIYHSARPMLDEWTSQTALCALRLHDDDARQSGQDFRTFVVNHTHKDDAMGYPLLLTLPMKLTVTMWQIRARVSRMASPFLKSRRCFHKSHSISDLPYRLWAQWGRRNQPSLEIVPSHDEFDLRKIRLKFEVRWTDVTQFVCEAADAANRARDQSVRVLPDAIDEIKHITSGQIAPLPGPPRAPLPVPPPPPSAPILVSARHLPVPAPIPTIGAPMPSPRPIAPMAPMRDLRLPVTAPTSPTPSLLLDLIRSKRLKKVYNEYKPIRGTQRAPCPVPASNPQSQQETPSAPPPRAPLPSAAPVRAPIPLPPHLIAPILREFTFVPADSSLPPIVFHEEMRDLTHISELKCFVAEKLGVCVSQLFVCAVWNGLLHRLQDTSGLDSFNHNIFVYHCPRQKFNFDDAEESRTIEVTHRAIGGSGAIGYPLLITLPTMLRTTMREIRARLLPMVLPFVRDQDINEVPFQIWVQWGSGYWHYYELEITDSDESFELQHKNNLEFRVYWFDTSQYGNGLNEPRTGVHSRELPRSDAPVSLLLPIAPPITPEMRYLKVRPPSISSNDPGTVHPLDDDPVWGTYLRAMCECECQRVVIISRDNLEVLAASDTRHDSREKWRRYNEYYQAQHELAHQQLTRIRTRVQMIASNWCREADDRQIVLPSVILDIIRHHIYPMHLLHNIDDIQQLKADWNDQRIKHFYFWRRKWIIQHKEWALSYPREYQYLLCYNTQKKRCLVVFQSRRAWIIGQVPYRRTRSQSAFEVRMQIYETLAQRVFDSVWDEEMNVSPPNAAPSPAPPSEPAQPTDTEHTIDNMSEALQQLIQNGASDAEVRAYVRAADLAREKVTILNSPAVEHKAAV